MRFIFNIHAAHTARHCVVEEALTLSQNVPAKVETDPATLNRYLRVHALTTGINYGADPALGPTDFHAYVEAYLGDRWYMFDPSGTAIPMGFVRFGTGRDAADVAFATIFGSVTSCAPRISIEAIAGADGRLVMPYHCAEALSTDS